MPASSSMLDAWASLVNRGAIRRRGAGRRRDRGQLGQSGLRDQNRQFSCGFERLTRRDNRGYRDGFMGMKSMQGQKAVPFELRDHRGEMHRQKDFTGNWLVLVFHRHLA